MSQASRVLLGVAVLGAIELYCAWKLAAEGRKWWAIGAAITGVPVLLFALDGIAALQE